MRMNVAKSVLASDTRAVMHTWLAEVGCSQEVIGDALIVVDELVTNVVTHAESDSVVVAVLDDMRLRLEVHDSDPTPPVAVEPTSAGGLGLLIVAAHSDSWGWRPTEYGKRVWTETLC